MDHAKQVDLRPSIRCVQPNVRLLGLFQLWQQGRQRSGRAATEPPPLAALALSGGRDLHAGCRLYCRLAGHAASSQRDSHRHAELSC